VPPAAGAATAPAASSLLRTEPKGLRLPYSEENLALVRRSESVAIATPKPDAVKPDAPKPEAPAAGAKPAAPLANPEAPAAKPTETENADGIDWSWPATGKIVATFNGSSVKGIAIGGRVGDPVYATAAGKVVYSGEGIPAYGKLIVIRHSETYLSAYAHNSQILVKDGQTVARGQKIAEIGTTGTDAAQLHFEIRRQGKPVDPLQFLPARP
jgi:lipoprotein NlpD